MYLNKKLELFKVNFIPNHSNKTVFRDTMLAIQTLPAIYHMYKQFHVNDYAH